MEENKFNFSEEENNKEKAVEQSKDAVRKDAKGLWQSINTFFSELLDFREDTDRDATVNAIKGDISFKGATAWILICSIFVASVGLNANSTAVVIGAMLISPLMGPILGVGLSIAINDIDTLKRSLINLAIMIALSLITAFLFFRFFPLSEDTSELLGRVQPDIRDVLIAFFGGLALIIARTKRGTIASVIFGVAIATALMPPLCTAGYGLAKGNWEYFFGAMYLFTINTIFIALATFLVLKVLRFPMLKYANSKKRRFISRMAMLLAIVVMVPAGFTFFSVYQESTFEVDAQAFINKELDALPHSEYIKKNSLYKYGGAENSVIELNSFGLDEIPESTISVLQNRMASYPALSKYNTKLKFNQSRSQGLDNFKYMEELRTRDSLDLLSQSEKIRYLENKVKQLSQYEQNYIPFEGLTNEVEINYENIDEFSYAKVINTNFKKTDTLSVFSVKWIDSLTNESVRAKEREKLEKWLKLKLNTNKLEVKRVN
ncbi:MULTISPECIES: TIGR00341 family protein [Hwangdonia]|uniref:TIGR00341 family protein n=1 Tax=Hwangdonia seohaensis TaxID=1240727 RepID=A0ABW3RCJ2_9FLAO|nr:TIGR00341 family protein [Hwangdonia seohaensis]